VRTSPRTGEFLKNGGIQAMLLINAFIMVYPLFVMVISSFKTNAEIFTSPFAMPESFSLANAEKVWMDTNFIRYLANSIGVTAVSIILIVVVSTMAAYAIARYEFRGSTLILMFFLSGMTVPLKLAIIPLFIELDTLHLLNTYAGLVLVYVAMGIPSAVFIMTGFLRSLPRELEEAPPDATRRRAGPVGRDHDGRMVRGGRAGRTDRAGHVNELQSIGCAERARDLLLRSRCSLPRRRQPPVRATQESRAAVKGF